MPRLLIILAHPTLHTSRINRAMAEAVTGLDGVTLHDLYEQYPDMHIAVDAEQRLLSAHDIVVFQHPMFWYSCPAILKEWQDNVLQPGFAYGDGAKLPGKRMLSAISTGGTSDAYARGGLNHFTIHELLAPFEQVARFCGMAWLPPFVVHGAFALAPNDISREASRYRDHIVTLRDSRDPVK
jgi:glutathione-regulated potassium-efflux system ancillary protein KefG